MRDSSGVFPLTEGDVAYGIFLKASYVAEHETGIERLQALFGIVPGDRPRGIPSRTATNGVIPVLAHTESKLRPYRRGAKAKPGPTCTTLLIGRSETYLQESLAQELGNRLADETERTFYGEWDWEAFCVHAAGDGPRALLSKLADAATSGDIAIWTGGAGSNPFARAGLAVAVASEIPEEGRAHMLAADLDRNALLDAAAETRIEERLKEASGSDRHAVFRKFGFFALSPRWAPKDDDGTPKGTAHPVVFWLNPMDQKANNHGWFTVEDLDAWMIGEGPVPKKDDARR